MSDRWKGPDCPWCGAPRSKVEQAFFMCRSWDQINPQDGFSPRFQTAECKAAQKSTILQR